MILRRLAESIRAQNWFTVLLEVLIVVIGIFVGLQVDDWNRARIQQDEESEYLARLADDLRESIEGTKFDIDWMSKTARLGNNVMQSLEACDLPKEQEDDFATGLYRIGKVVPFYLVRGTLDELKSTGKLATFSNTKLKRKINDAIQEYEAHRDIVIDLRGRMAPQISYIDSRVGTRITGPIGGLSKVSIDKQIGDFEELCKDRRFLLAVTAATNYSWNQIERSLAILKIVEDLERNLLSKSKS